MSVTFKNTIRAALILAAGLPVAILANGVKTGPDPKTSTGRELTGPGAHHEEYIVQPVDTVRVAPVAPLDTTSHRNMPGEVRPEDTVPKPNPPRPPTGPGTPPEPPGMPAQ